MPHFQIDYSANVEDWVDMSAFCEELRKTAAGIDTFPVPGIRVRALRVDHYSIADGSPKHGFIDISIRLRAGRLDDVKRVALQKLFEAAQTFLAPILSTHSLALSLEMRDIDPDLSPKTGSIRDHMAATTQES